VERRVMAWACLLLLLPPLLYKSAEVRPKDCREGIPGPGITWRAGNDGAVGNAKMVEVQAAARRR